MAVHFVKRLWKIIFPWKNIFEYIQGRDHFHVDIVIFEVVQREIWKNMNETSIWNRCKSLENVQLKNILLKSISWYFLQTTPIYLGTGLCGCPFCPKTMKDSSAMKKHIRIHTGEKPFACHYCEYRSNTKGNLKAHQINMHLK